MGNYIRSLSDAATLIASDNTWIEGLAIQQLETTSKLKHMLQVTGMPDLHPGRGYPVGAAFFSKGHLYPALVGGDIGCGMALWQTDIKTIGLKLDKLEKRLGSIDHVVDDELRFTLWEEITPIADHGYAPGTIGAGNHFAELQQLDNVYDHVMAEQLGLSKAHLQLLVHSGSRGLGGIILNNHVKSFGHHGLVAGSIESIDYMTQHHHALAFAVQNRELIGRRILQRLRSKSHKLVDISHNHVVAATIKGVQGWLHRKGAAPADQGLVVIPGSRGDYSYLVKPMFSEDGLLSLAHGAGRKWLRRDCKGRLSAHYHINQLTRTALGGRVICADRELLYEEAPQAYKSIDTVIDSLQGAHLIELVARFKPVLTYKSQKENS